MSEPLLLTEQMEQVKQRLADVLATASQLGADSAEASMSKQQGLSVATRFGEVETVEFTNDGALGITVYQQGRKGSASTADLSDAALHEAVKAAIEIAKYTSVDPCSGLADADQLQYQPKDLDLYHPHPITAEQAIDIARQTELAALESDPRLTNSDGANFASYEGFKVYGNSHGQLVAYPSSRHSLSCMLIASQGEEMQRDYAYTVSRDFHNLSKPEDVGLLAAKETISRLGTRKISTQKVPVMFRADIANGLFGHLIAAISGGNLYRKSSFLLDALGKQIFPQHLTIVERPHLLKGLASSSFDAEGVKTADMDIIDKGELQNFLLTSYSARKLQRQTNGHAGGIHNWQVSANGGDFNAMLKQLGTGLLVTELMGQGVNIVNGDYSRGAAGFWVENGEIAFPVAEVTIAGNLKDMFNGLVATGNDYDERGSICTGSVLIEQMQVSGQ